MQSTLGEFQETKSEQPFALQNSKLLKVSLNQITIQAKAGAMVAYQGDVSFEHAGSGGMSRMLKKAMSGEGTTLMKMTGTGEVFLADTAQDIHLIYLENDAITVNGTNLLAFDAGIDWDIKRVEGVSGMMGGGLFNTALQGTGWVAIVSDGPPVLLNTGDAADVRRSAGRDHLVVEPPDQHQDRHQAEELHRARLGRVGPDGVQRPGLGAGAAERGARSGGAVRRRWRSRGPAGEPRRLDAYFIF